MQLLACVQNVRL